MAERVPEKDAYTVCKYEAVVPMEIGKDGDSSQDVATTKEEEWVTKRTTELTTTKQVETRVKRQVVLEDGKVVDDSGPVVSTNTKQDTEKQHYETREHLTPDALALPSSTNPQALQESSKSWEYPKEIPPGINSLTREVQEQRVISKEQTDELLETEDVKHLGDIDDEAYLAAVRSGASDLRSQLRRAEDELRALQPAEQKPRVLRHTTRSHRVADTEDTRQRSTALPDGRVLTERHTIDEHEEVTQEDVPEGEAGSLDSGSHTCLSIKGEERLAGTRETSQPMVNGVADAMRYFADTKHAERQGDPASRMRREHWESLSDRLRKAKENANRKDAVTKRPLDFDAEERSRKAETNKWLDHHFGSDSRSSQSSRDSLVSGADQHNNTKQETEEGYFNITIKNRCDPPVLVACVPKQPILKQTTDKYFQGVSEWNERYKEPVRPARTVKASRGLNSSISTPALHMIDHPAETAEPSMRPSPPVRRRQRRQIGKNPQSNIETNGYVEPPPDYSPRSRREVKIITTQNHPSRSTSQSPPTRLEAPRGRSVHFPQSPKQTVGAAIGQGIRKLVGKIRSVSAERKMRRHQSGGRISPPAIGAEIDMTYQKCNVIDAHIEADRSQPPTQRYYLGEDPYCGSIYGRENKYDGSKEQQRSEPHVVSTLGRYGKVQKRRAPSPTRRDKTVTDPPTRSAIARSKSFTADQHSQPVYRSNPQLAVTHDDLKSPSLVVSLVNKSRTNNYTDDRDKRTHFTGGHKSYQRANELYRTPHASESITTG